MVGRKSANLILNWTEICYRMFITDSLYWDIKAEFKYPSSVCCIDIIISAVSPIPSSAICYSYGLLPQKETLQVN